MFIREPKLAWAQRQRALVSTNPRVAPEEIVGYELVLNFNGVPFQAIPRSAAEIKGKTRLQLLSVNEPEAAGHNCRKLLAKRGARWELSNTGQLLLELLAQ